MHLKLYLELHPFDLEALGPSEYVVKLSVKELISMLAMVLFCISILERS